MRAYAWYKLTKYNKKNNKHKQEINENIIWNKIWILKMQMKKAREYVLISKPIYLKWMVNVFFYRLKFRTINIKANYLSQLSNLKIMGLFRLWASITLYSGWTPNNI